jgi:hypothetical protein
VIKITRKIAKQSIIFSKRDNILLLCWYVELSKGTNTSIYSVLQLTPLLPGNELLLILQTEHLKLVLSKSNQNVCCIRHSTFFLFMPYYISICIIMFIVKLHEVQNFFSLPVILFLKLSGSLLVRCHPTFFGGVG